MLVTPQDVPPHARICPQLPQYRIGLDARLQGRLFEKEPHQLVHAGHAGTRVIRHGRRVRDMRPHGRVCPRRAQCRVRLDAGAHCGVLQQRGHQRAQRRDGGRVVVCGVLLRARRRRVAGMRRCSRCGRCVLGVLLRAARCQRVAGVRCASRRRCRRVLRMLLCAACCRRVAGVLLPARLGGSAVTGVRGGLGRIWLVPRMVRGRGIARRRVTCMRVVCLCLTSGTSSTHVVAGVRVCAHVMARVRIRCGVVHRVRCRVRRRRACCVVLVGAAAARRRGGEDENGDCASHDQPSCS
jgi:hypothetical protein